MEHTGFEPVTSTLPVWRAPNCANAPLQKKIPDIPVGYPISIIKQSLLLCNRKPLPFYTKKPLFPAPSSMFSVREFRE